jgi:hypothetical protein
VLGWIGLFIFVGKNDIFLYMSFLFSFVLHVLYFGLVCLRGFCFVLFCFILFWDSKKQEENILRRSYGYRGSCGCLRKVARHVLLQVEVSELLTLLNLEQRLQLGVGIDLTTILLILKAVGANVGIDLASDLRASKLCADRPSKKLGELLRNQSGLNKTGRSTIAGLALTLGSLLGSTHLTSNVALKSSEVAAERRKTRAKCVKFGAELGEERTQGSLKGGGGAISVGLTSGSGGGGDSNRRGSNRCISLGGLRGFGSLGSRSTSSGCGDNGSGC